jgi:hypothetical protein
MSNAAQYPLRLPASLKQEAEKRANEDGTSLNQFISSAVAEKLAAMRTAEFFRERRARGDLAVFDRIMSRKTGEPPIPGDERPKAKRHRLKSKR